MRNWEYIADEKEWQVLIARLPRVNADVTPKAFPLVASPRISGDIELAYPRMTRDSLGSYLYEVEVNRLLKG